MRRPLYLLGGEGTEVRLDGPSLLVSGTRRADGRYPLAQVSRVTSSSTARWETEAIIACLGSRIPVTFVGGRGRIIGFCLPLREPRSSDASKLREFFAFPFWKEVYDNWLSAETRKAVLDQLDAFHVRTEDLRPLAARRFLLDRVAANVSRAERDRIMERLNGLAGSLLAGLFSHERLPTRYAVTGAGVVNLHEDFLSVISWELLPIVAEAAKRGYRDRDPDSRAFLVGAFEKRSIWIKERYARLLESLLLRVHDAYLVGQ